MTKKSVEEIKKSLGDRFNEIEARWMKELREQYGNKELPQQVLLNFCLAKVMETTIIAEALQEVVVEHAEKLKSMYTIFQLAQTILAKEEVAHHRSDN